jgi:hypothetical protein
MDVYGRVSSLPLYIHILLEKKVIFDMGTISKKVNGELLFGNPKVG